MSRRRMLLVTFAGQIDSGMASLATFVSGVFAARNLSPLEMGGYTMVFVAFVSATHVSTQLLFIPFEVDSIRRPKSARAGVLRASLPSGGRLALAACMLAGLGAVPVWTRVDQATLVPLVITGMLAALLSPIQDHMRRVFHILERSFVAAVMSIAQVVVAVLGLWLIGWGLGPAWAPFGALAIANVVSIAIGLAAYPWAATSYVPPSMRSLTSTGKWLLVAGMSEPILAYTAIFVVGLIAGLDTVGYAESARIVARPLTVIGLGLAAVFGPKAVEHASLGNLLGASQVRRRIWTVAIALGVPYMALIGAPSEWNPIASLIPIAYVVPGLVMVAAIGALALAITIPFYSELLGLRAEKTLAGIAVTAGLVQLAVAPAAAVVGAFALPIGVISAAATFVLIARRRLRSLY